MAASERTAVGLRVVLVMPEPRASEQLEAVLAAGHESVVLPFAVLEPLDAPNHAALAAESAAHDFVVLVSPYAVRRAIRVLRPVLARAGALAVVGPGSRSALLGLWPEGSCQPRVLVPEPGREDADGLLGLPEFARGSGRRVLVVRGEGGRRDWIETLRARGFSVHEVSLYGRRAISPARTAEATLRRWLAEAGAICFVVSTRSMADSLADWLRERVLLEQATRCVAWVPHRRIAESLEASGWQDARVAGGGRGLVAAAIESGTVESRSPNTEGHQ
ncbi:MAG: uroporphyrinogen-III synthase [Burkholderiaceae bacterium]|nr:uroporphyrinogen-III synthase [Burkholderiaceae bacterium]